MSDPTPIAREPDEAQARGPATPADFARYRPTCAECGAPVVLGDESSCTFHGDALCCLACAGRGEPQTTPPAEPAEERPVPETKTSETISTTATWPTGSCGHKVRPPKTAEDSCRKCEKRTAAKRAVCADCGKGIRAGYDGVEHERCFGCRVKSGEVEIHKGAGRRHEAKPARPPRAPTAPAHSADLPAPATLPVPYLVACRDELARRAESAREVLRALGEAA